MKHLTDQIRNVSQNLIEHYLKKGTLGTRGEVSVSNESSYKSLYKRSKNIQIVFHLSSNPKLEDELDHIDDDALKILKMEDQVIKHGEKLFLALLRGDLKVTQFGSQGEILLSGLHEIEWNQEEGDLPASEREAMGTELIIKNDTGFIKLKETVRVGGQITSRTESLTLATEKNLVEVLHKLIDLF